MPLLNIKNLRAFVAVAQSGSVTKASAMIRRAQSAVTRSIRELEMEVGVPLFERRSQGMLLTHFGRALLERVERAFFEMETARNAFRSSSAPKSLIEKAPVFSLSISKQRLLVLVELVNQRHMGAVADSLGISQPAASQSLREIEASVGSSLFHRRPEGMQPTQLGSLLGVHICRALAEIRAGELETSSLRGTITGRVVVGTLSLGRIGLLPRAIVQLTESYPDLRVATVEGTYDHLAMRLRAGDVDFIIGALRLPEHTMDFTSEVVAHDMLSIVVRRTHPLARKRNVEFSDLSSAKWVLPQYKTPTRELIENALRLHGCDKPNVIVESADLHITREVLVNSDLITATFTHLLHEEIQAKTLVALPLAMPETRRAIGILQRSSSSPSIAAQLLMTNIRAIAQA